MSGMRPTGALHLGHYHGVLKNWVRLQNEYECYFSVVDWHALTTDYETPDNIEKNVWEMIIDWLAVGINPGSAKLYIQSRIPEHAELHLLLSMITPQSWLERLNIGSVTSSSNASSVSCAGILNPIVFFFGC